MRRLVIEDDQGWACAEFLSTCSRSAAKGGNPGIVKKSRDVVAAEDRNEAMVRFRLEPQPERQTERKPPEASASNRIVEVCPTGESSQFAARRSCGTRNTSRRVETSGEERYTLGMTRGCVVLFALIPESRLPSHRARPRMRPPAR